MNLGQASVKWSGGSFWLRQYQSGDYRNPRKGKKNRRISDGQIVIREVFWFVRRMFTGPDISLLMNTLKDMEWEAKVDRATIKKWSNKKQHECCKIALDIATELVATLTETYGDEEDQLDVFALPQDIILQPLRDGWTEDPYHVAQRILAPLIGTVNLDPVSHLPPDSLQPVYSY
ncbi:hypothetical protein BDV96DRAFT_652995 [Lophiotrema nucula]|uniref:Uncharacterized protein n=1 Tax=Lophiotrema nucula TaxID=690887 RepID=A0A6A5YMX7_9PLEO|nr:hypothetical protein BDV96DRAFT_652995 [Lophiotrema nucula]